MKMLVFNFLKIVYNRDIESQHTEVLSDAVGGSVGHWFNAMDRLTNWFLAGNRCRMSAQAKDWLEAHFAK